MPTQKTNAFAIGFAERCFARAIPQIRRTNRIQLKHANEKNPALSALLYKCDTGADRELAMQC